MPNPIELARIIEKDFLADHTEIIYDYGYANVFGAVLNGPESTKEKNKIVCYIIHAFHHDSNWLDLKKDRIDNKNTIIENLEGDPASKLWTGIVANKNEPVNISTFSFLETLKDWRWRSIFDLVDYAAKMSRFASKETEEEKQWEELSKDGEKTTLKEEVDIEKIVKVNKQKGDLIDQSVAARKKADVLMEDIRKQFLSTDTATQADFNFTFTETAKKKDIMSWREFIKSPTVTELQQAGRIR